MKTVKWRHEYQASSWAIDHVSLHFKIDPQTTDVINKMSVRKVGTENSLFLDGEDLELVALFVDGQPFPYQKTDFGLGLELTQNQAEIEIHTRIHPTQNTTLSGLYSSGTTVCTQCEAEGFRRITYFQDRPDVLSRYTTIIEADKARFPYLLANGNCTQEKDLENGRWQVTWTDPFPKPCYLFALVGGDFDLVEGSFQTKSQREIQLRVFTEKGQGSKASFALECLKRSMAWDEQRFGLEYDLDTYMIVAVSDFNFGAMENKGLNVFNTKYVLADPTISTDQDFIQVESVIGHEYFHNWTGNRVTCRDWFQLSLKEGLTVFRDQEFTSDLHSRPVKRIQDVRIIRTAQFAEDASPMAHPIRPDSYIEMNNFYTVTVYNKGAEVIRMIHTLIGETAFQAGMKTYFERHDGQAVTCEDFVRAMEAGSGQDLTQFRRWYSQPGTPTVRVEHIYDESSKRFELTLHQSCPTLSNYAAPEPFHIPIKMGFLNTKGETLAARLSGSTHAEEWVLSLTAPQQTFVFEVDEKPIVSILRDFSAPIKLEIERSTDERALLWAHDPNLFNRWEAGQAYFCEAIQHGVAHGADAVAHWVPQFLQAASDCLKAAHNDPALIAEALTMPDLRSLAESYQPTIPLDALIQVREQFMHALGIGLWNELAGLYSKLFLPSSNHADWAIRSLRNALLRLMCASQKEEAWELAINQYRKATNMTDRLAACSLLAHSHSKYREEALGDYEERFSHEALAMDKWFALQALSKREDTLAQVQRLLLHPKMNIKNPNKVHALLGSFSYNMLRFHQEDGSGYQFMTNKVLELDHINPHLSGRLVRSIMNWQRFEGKRRQHLKNQLQRIADQSDISPDVYEIVAKSLQND